MIYDFHTHSSISKDSNEELIYMVMAAREKELDGICFTQHLDPYFPDGYQPFLIDWNKYKQEIFNARSMFPEMEIYIGIEAGLNKNSYCEIDRQIRENDVDFVLGSMHCENDITIGAYGYYQRYEKKKVQEKYIECLIENIKAFDNFDVVAHIGFLSKFAVEPNWEIHFKDHAELIDELLKVVVSKNKGIEVNTSGLLNSGYTLPSKDIIIRYKELGGEIITIGSDAHSKNRVAYEFDYVKKLLRECGFEYLTKFVNRKPVFYTF